MQARDQTRVRVGCVDMSRCDVTLRVGYVAPEVLAMNLQSLPTPAADVFSLGATLYEAGRAVHFHPTIRRPPIRSARDVNRARCLELS